MGENSWRFNAKMDCCGAAGQSGLPIVVPLHFVGDTPVIMMTDTNLPGIGTFTVRLLFYGDRYAGTWQHGAGRWPDVRPHRADAGRALTSHGAQSLRRAEAFEVPAIATERAHRAGDADFDEASGGVGRVRVRPDQDAAVGVSTDRPPPDRREGHRARCLELRADEALAGAIGGVGVGERQVHRRAT